MSFCDGGRNDLSPRGQPVTGSAPVALSCSFKGGPHDGRVLQIIDPPAVWVFPVKTSWDKIDAAIQELFTGWPHVGPIHRAVYRFFSGDRCYHFDKYE